MAPGGDKPENADDGMRKRRSIQYGDEDFLPSQTSPELPSPAIPQLDGQPRPDEAPLSSSSAVETPTRPSISRLSTDLRVRFSTDLEQHGPRQPAGAGPGADSIDEMVQASADSRPGQRPDTHNLTIDTHRTDNNPPESGQGSQASPRQIISPISPRSTGRASPLSPTGRNRGYSLRSSLFRRNVGGQAVSPSETIELNEKVGPSHQSVNQGGDSTRPTSSEKDNGFMQMSPARAELGILASESFAGKGGKGVPALPNYDTWLQRKDKKKGITQNIKAFSERARKFVLRIQDIPPSKDGRHIDLDPSRKDHLIDERTNQPYTSNWIRSTRYSAWNFLPRQLVAQFSKLANFYFLCVSILQMIPGLSTTGTYTTIVPLLFFVALSIAKEGYDDLRRYRLDKAENNREAQVLHAYQATKPTAASAASDPESLASPSIGPLHWVKTKWKDLNVGDIVKLDRNDAAPADLALLYSGGGNGVAYVETMALDGETNLKSKQATASIAKAIKAPDDVASCEAEFVVEDPNQDLYNFEGKVTVDGQTAPLTVNEIIFRGSILRNTPDAIGMVIYSGEECRIRMNANKNPRIKAPALQYVVNRIVIIIVIFVLALAIFNTVAYQIWSNRTEDELWYLSNASVAFFPILTSFIIMFNTMIPLSLYVSLEIVKLAQMYFLNDIDMYDEASNTPCEPRTSTINEELGQVSYIFSDKTGTLTDNSMKFRKMSIAGTAWLHNADLKENDKKNRLHKRNSKGKKPVRKSIRSAKEPSTPGLEGPSEAMEPAEPSYNLEPSESQWKSSARPGKSQLEMLTTDMIRYIQRKPFTLFAKKARLFLLNLALCHTCLPEVHEDGTTRFMAASPDELALVQAAQEMGFLVINRDVNTITLKIASPSGADSGPITETYKILDVIEFSSKRKRMSIVVRFPDGRICLFCKGADSIIMQRLRLSTLANKKMVEIERRANKRKSLEAQYAIARKSEQLERRSSVGGRKSMTDGSVTRPSFNLRRASTALSQGSMGAMGRASIGGRSLRPVRDEVDQWLRERERDVDIESAEESSIYYSPRPSGLTPRQSGQLDQLSLYSSESTSSLQLDVIDELVEEGLVADEAAVIERCFQHINDFATEGLRTLLYGHRFLNEEEYATWKKGYLEATTSLVDRQRLIEEAGERIEQNLELSGATAIEDKLQNGVPEAIDKLRRAKIKMWMLTGDKRETAINIGHSCRLIKDYSSVTVLDHETGEVEQSIGAAILAINRGTIAHSVVVVDGQTLAMINDLDPLKNLFYELAVIADSVICCRASPSQKAGLVRGIRKRVKKSITLAIGDGANDIAMIQEAHVGIGITGKEGLQAARTSDYSIAQFRFLTKLLLVHGRWNYIRTCKYTVGTFWKEMLFYLTQALYQRSVGYTGTSLYESWSLSMFNTLFTSLPVIFIGIFEKDLQPSTLLAVPELYAKGQRNGGFNFKVYLWWMFMASSEAMVVYFCMLGLYGQAKFTEDDGIYALGVLTYSAVVIIISCKLQLIEMHSKSILAATSFILSIGGWFLWNIILCAVYAPGTKIYHVRDSFFSTFGRSGTWWLTLLLILISVLVFEITVKSVAAAFFTTDEDVFMQLEKDPDVRRRFEEAAGMVGEGQGKRAMREEVVELDKDEEERRRREQEAREGEVKELLRNRRDELPNQQGDGNRGIEAETTKRSGDVDEMLSKGFGKVRRE